MADTEDLLARLSTGVGLPAAGEPGLFDTVPADLLAERMAELGGHAGCDLAFVLARRGDVRGVAELARQAMRLATAHRALGYLDQLDMLDMVPPPQRDDYWRRRAEAAACLGWEPSRLELVAERLLRWPDSAEPVIARIWRFELPGQRPGALLIGPSTVRVDGGVRGLDEADLVSLLVGRAVAGRLFAVPADRVDRDQIEQLVRSRAYYYLSEPRLERAYELGPRIFLVLGAKARGKPGYLIGDPRGDLPIQWLPSPPDEPDFDADRACWIWLGRLWRSGE